MSELWNNSPISEQNKMMEAAKLSWEQRTLLRKYVIIHSVVIHTMVQKYQLQPSYWTPDQPIENLIKILKEKGPMAVGGNLGKACYNVEALCSSRKIAGRSIYYFPKGAERIKTLADHVIVLIGAEKIGEQEVIYYHDNESSDPVAGKRIYTQSYKTFTSSIERPFIPKFANYVAGDLVETQASYGVHAHPLLQPRPAHIQGFYLPPNPYKYDPFLRQAIAENMLRTPSLESYQIPTNLPPILENSSKDEINVQEKTFPHSASEGIERLIILGILDPKDRNNSQKISEAIAAFIKICNEHGLFP
jgi:hypothetical protein